MFCAFGFFGTAEPSTACVPQKPGVRQTTGTVVEVVEVLVLVDVLVELVLVLVLVEVLVLVLVDVLEVLVLVDVEVEVLVVPQLFVHESPSTPLPSSHASPEVTCTMPSPQIVHGFSFCRSRQVFELAVAAGQPTWPAPPTVSVPQMFGLPPARTAGQHSSPTGTPPSGFVSQVSKAWFTMPSPQTAGKNNVVLPCPPPSAQGGAGGPGGVKHASRSVVPVSVRAKNCPFDGTNTGLTAFTVMVTRSSSWFAPTATPPAVIVMATVLPDGSPMRSGAQVATPAARLVQLTNSSVPGSGVVQDAVVHASCTLVVPNNVAAAGLVFVGSLVLVFWIRIVIVICSSIVRF
jgi:hypothetical protein